MNKTGREQLRKSILDANDMLPEPVEIPEWNISAFLRGLDGEQRFALSHLEAPQTDGKDNGKQANKYYVEAWVCLGLVDKNGEQIFTLDERVVLSKKNPLVLERLYERIAELSGVTKEQEEEAEKKSERAPS